MSPQEKEKRKALRGMLGFGLVLVQGGESQCHDRVLGGCQVQGSLPLWAAPRTFSGCLMQVKVVKQKALAWLLVICGVTPGDRIQEF